MAAGVRHCVPNVEKTARVQHWLEKLGGDAYPQVSLVASHSFEEALAGLDGGEGSNRPQNPPIAFSSPRGTPAVSCGRSG